MCIDIELLSVGGDEEGSCESFGEKEVHWACHLKL